MAILQHSSSGADTRTYFVSDVVIADLRARANAFKRDEHAALRDGDAIKAREARLKAGVLEATAQDYERQQAALRIA